MSQHIKPSTFVRKMYWLFVYVGAWRGTFICLLKPIAIVSSRLTSSEWYWRFVESSFDRRHGVDTVSMVSVDKLGISQEAQEAAVFYEPTPIMEFGYLISRLHLPFHDYAFVDLGSGKGKVLLLASAFPFKRITGVEISPLLHEIAQSNIEEYNLAKRFSVVESKLGDASNYEFSNDNLVLFCFNPFHREILDRLLDNLHASLVTNPRSVLIIYSNPVYGEAIAGRPWLKLRRTELGGWASVYEADAIYLLADDQLGLRGTVQVS